MPWFCAGPAKKSSKKNKKRKRKSGRKEIERCQKFVVIVQDYVAATMDEVSVHRGQVVEMVCTKGNWVYIRGNNSSTGYVPKDYTLEVDNNEVDNTNIANGITITTLLENGNIAGPAPSTRSINVGTLQHSGSSVTSVEVHQVNSSDVEMTERRASAEGRVASELGMSQAIYEVPRCPDGSAAEAQGNSNEGSNGHAPALPPRSTCLPTAAEIQHSLTSYKSSSNTPYHYRSPSQRHRPGNLALANANTTGQPCPYHRPRFPYGPFPPNAVDAPPPSCTCNIPLTNSSTRSSFSSSAHHHNPAATPQVPGSLNSRSVPCTTPGYSPSSVWTPSRGNSAGFRESPLSQHRRHLHQQQMVTTPSVPPTPGSAGLPSATPASPVISNFALTPPRMRGGGGDSRDFTESLPTMGNGIRVSSSNSSYSSHGQRAMARPQRSRRYSSDFQIHSTISENLDVRRNTSNARKDYIRRQSQPCLIANSTQAVQAGSEKGNNNGYSTPITSQQQLQHRPNKLPVRRSLSMQEPFSLRQPLGCRNSCPCTPQQLMQQHQQQQSVDGGTDGQMQRAVSIETAQRIETSAYYTAATPTALVTSVEVATTPQRTFPTTSAAAANVRRRRSRSSSNRLDSVPSIEEEGVEPLSHSNPDDVFLPESRKKPLGIFRCSKTYTPKFKGEISLQENELVIVLDYGMGPWAWVMTTSNVEGLVSKSVLVRYQNGLLATLSPTTITSDAAVFDDCDSGRGTITKRKGPGHMNLGVDACTQTEPVTDSAPSTMPRSVSVGPSTGYSTSSGLPTNENSPLSTAERAAAGLVSRAKKKKRISGNLKEAKDEHMVFLEAAATAVAKHAEHQRKTRSQPPPQEWFNTIDSLDDRERIKPYVDSRAGSRLPSSSQLLESSLPPPPMAGLEQISTTEIESSSGGTDSESSKDKNPESAKAGGSGDVIASKSKEVTTEKKKSAAGSSPKIKSPKRRGKAAAPAHCAPANLSAAMPAEQGKPARNHMRGTQQVVKPGTVHYHDRISGTGSVDFNGKTDSDKSAESPPKLDRQKSRPQIGLSNVLTAVKDYIPAPNSKNCIPIKEGDVLHLQTHMHYPKGWMWVWHTSRRSFGYVPKNYVAYTYDTVRRGRPRINTVEDEV